MCTITKLVTVTLMHTGDINGRAGGVENGRLCAGDTFGRDAIGSA